jgi:hypothetical protein
MAGTQSLAIVAGLHSGKHWISSSAVIAEKGLPTLWIEVVEGDDMADFVALFFGEKLLNTSMSVAATVEHVDSSGVEDKVDDDSSE